MEKYRLNLKIILTRPDKSIIKLKKDEEGNFYEDLSKLLANVLYGIKPKEAKRTRTLADEIYQYGILEKNLSDLAYLEKEINKIEWSTYCCLVKAEIKDAFLEARRKAINEEGEEDKTIEGEIIEEK